MEQYKVITENNDIEEVNIKNEREINSADPSLDKDSLVFHGVAFDKIEEETNDDAEIKKNIIEHKIRNIMKSEWGIDCNASFKHVFRFQLVRFFSSLTECSVQVDCRAQGEWCGAYPCSV